MVLKKIDALFNDIQKIRWFENIGKQIVHKNLKIISNKTKAKQHWLSEEFEEARSVAWEAFRSEIVKKEKLYMIWDKRFDECNDLLKQTLNKSPIAQDLIQSVGQTTEEFCSALPFLGALGELLISDSFPTYNFNSRQIPFFIEGHWICGWNGELFEDRFVYPQTKFVIY